LTATGPTSYLEDIEGLRGKAAGHLRAGRVTRRASGPDDEPFLTRVFASTRPAELALLGWSAEQQAEFAGSQSRFQRRAYAERHPGCAFEIVLVDRTPVGRLFLAREASELRVVDIALLPEFRGAGIGTQLLRRILDEAADRGVAVCLEVDLGNPARRLYERLGFAIEASTELQLSMRWTPAGATQEKTAS
jgi:ribosomal protein S18 acetylase RimI-like enzyme